MAAYVETFSDPAWQRVGRAAPHNEHALISFCCALVLPLALCHALLARVAAPSDALEGALGMLLSVACAPAAVMAVVAGHRAVVRARKLPAKRARQRLAMSGLVGGYLCVALILGIRVLPALVEAGQPARANVSMRRTLGVPHSATSSTTMAAWHPATQAPIGKQGWHAAPTCDGALDTPGCWHALSMPDARVGTTLRATTQHATDWRTTVAGYFDALRARQIR